MYPNTQNENQKPPPPAEYPQYIQPPATGVPVSSTNQYSAPNPPAPLHIQSQPRRPWSTGLFGCFEDVSNCCITCWCPCVTFGQVSEILDRGSSSCGLNGALYALICFVIGCPCLYSCFYRSKMRDQYLLNKSPCGDCLVHCCCEGCALCQEYRELKSRGFDMALGWHGNMEKQGHGVSTAPVTQDGMSR